MSLNTDVLVIGAGPIGLVHAWGMKYLNPELNIVVLEKYATYQRTHTLLMQPEQLKAIMKATGSEHHPTLVALLKQLETNPHIRIKTLQDIFTKLAGDSGVIINQNHEVIQDSIEDMINQEYPNTRLIIGADGVHSVVNQSLFPKQNQVKYELDFVLQLRFEINGKEKPEGIKKSTLSHPMTRKGLIATETVGAFADGKTPVALSIIISKEDFLKLQTATSKNPLKPYSKLKSPLDRQKEPKLPAHLNSFIKQYLLSKIKDTNASADQQIDRESITLSVNQSPVSYSKEIIQKHGQAGVMLVGDAALGLSYFKGLNAGLEASAKFLTTLSSAIKSSLKDKQAMDRQLKQYQTWFLKDFTPKKVKEVRDYSFWQVKFFVRIINFIKGLSTASVVDTEEDQNHLISGYFDYFSNNHLGKWYPFPHRDYDPVNFGQFDYVPLIHTFKKIIKIFVDYVKPYKSKQHMIQDFKQPLVGIANFFIGLGKIIYGILFLNPWILADGILSVQRGAIELVTTPLTWLLKPITRGIATLIHGGYKKIEENRGMQNLAKYAHNSVKNHLCSTDENILDIDKSRYALLAVCHDMHRKFDKSVKRGQASALQAEEHARYTEIQADYMPDQQKLIHYFSLFLPKQEKLSKVNNDQQANLAAGSR